MASSVCAQCNFNSKFIELPNAIRKPQLDQI